MYRLVDVRNAEQAKNKQCNDERLLAHAVLTWLAFIRHKNN